jgi:hypothetical protein
MDDEMQPEPSRPIGSTTEFGPIAVVAPPERGRSRRRPERLSGADAQGEDAEDTPVTGTPAVTRARTSKAPRRASTPPPASTQLPPSSGNPAPKRRQRRDSAVVGTVAFTALSLLPTRTLAELEAIDAVVAVARGLRLSDPIVSGPIDRMMSDDEQHAFGLLPEAERDVVWSAFLFQRVLDLEKEFNEEKRFWAEQASTDVAQMKLVADRQKCAAATSNRRLLDAGHMHERKMAEATAEHARRLLRSDAKHAVEVQDLNDAARRADERTDAVYSGLQDDVEKSKLYMRDAIQRAAMLALQLDASRAEAAACSAILAEARRCETVLRSDLDCEKELHVLKVLESGRLEAENRRLVALASENNFQRKLEIGIMQMSRAVSETKSAVATYLDPTGRPIFPVVAALPMDGVRETVASCVRVF